MKGRSSALRVVTTDRRTVELWIEVPKDGDFPVLRASLVGCQPFMSWSFHDAMREVDARLTLLSLSAEVVTEFNQPREEASRE